MVDVARILLVEDNEDLAFGLSSNLEYEGHQVTVEHNGQRGFVRARNTAPDLIILDLMLPGLDGFQFLRDLRGNGFTMPVLILTARGAESDKVKGLKLGADDYVTKPFGVLELMARVEALLRRDGRGRGGKEEHQTVGDVEIDLAARTARRGNEDVLLTPKEFDLLLALLRRDGAAVSRRDLMNEVWGYSSGVVSRTVDTHVAELRRKIERVPSDPQHILTVRKTGYRVLR